MQRFSGSGLSLVPDLELGPGCPSADRGSLVARWAPARAVVLPFGWHTLGVPGAGMRCNRAYPRSMHGTLRGKVYAGLKLESGWG